MKKLFFLLLLASALIFSACIIIFEDPNVNNPGVPVDTVKDFWANDFTNDSFYRVSAHKLYDGEHCTVWAETGTSLAAGAAQSIARAYDANIYIKMKNVFCVENFTYQGNNFTDTLALADAYTDGDGKLCILLLDIRDGYNGKTNIAYIGGYFTSRNMYSNDSLPPSERYSNKCDMIYLDTYPQRPGSQEMLSTLAHETQHLVNFMNSEALRNDYMDTWINEGLSAAAEWYYMGEHLNDRIDWYNNATIAKGSRINTGNNFFAWDQYADDSNLDDYATVYLFFQWLRLQSGGSTNIYKAISGSRSSDYNAIVGAMNGYNDWATLLKTWLAANYINALNGRYGYMNDPVLKNVKARTAPPGTRSVNLYPGEGVYSLTNSAGSTPTPGRNIKYAGLNKSTGDVNDTAVFASGALLTYNINTNVGGWPETGTTTGIAANVQSVPESLSARAVLSVPFRIDAGDMLRRNGYAEFIPPLTRLYPGIHDMGDNDN